MMMKILVVGLDTKEDCPYNMCDECYADNYPGTPDYQKCDYDIDEGECRYYKKVRRWEIL